MASGDLVPNDPDRSKMTSAEVQFALVISRMIDSIRNSPEDMRHVIYDLARYKLREQFTHTDVKEIQRTEQALETAIRGVEEFSTEQPNRIYAPPQLPEISCPGQSAPSNQSSALMARARLSETPARPRFVAVPKSIDVVSRPAHVLWQRLGRMAFLISVLIGILFAVQQHERLLLWGRHSLTLDTPNIAEERSAPVVSVSAPPTPVKSAPLRPSDYGVYAISNESLIELQQLPGRAPDLRIAVSAVIKTPGQSVLPNGHLRFIVFRKQIASAVSEHPDVRVIAKVAREFSAEAAGKKPSEDEQTWVIRNVSFAFRSSPVADNPEMYELHSEDPTLDLTPGRYALVLGIQSYDFSVAGDPVDPKQCIERIVSTSGTFYSACKKP